MKRWEKPVIAQITLVELLKHVQVAARSTMCGEGYYR